MKLDKVTNIDALKIFENKWKTPIKISLNFQFKANVF